MKEEIAKIKQELNTTDRSLYTNRNRLRHKEALLIKAKRLGGEGTREAALLQREIQQLQNVIRQKQSALGDLNTRLNELVGKFVLPKTQQELVAELDDSVPILLFPLRIETRFIGRELWLRVFPDDIAIHTHELELTRDEADAGIQFLRQKELAAHENDEAEKDRLEKGAWQVMAAAYGAPRAAWIIRQIMAAIESSLGNEDISFLGIMSRFLQVLSDPESSSVEKKEAIQTILSNGNPVIPTIEDPVNTFLQNADLNDDLVKNELLQIIKDGILTFIGFDLEALKPESWSRAPRTLIMPDRFVFVGVKNNQRIERQFTHIVRHPLILGPNPQELEQQLIQQGGDLVFAEDFAWMEDFEKAITHGMAIKVPLQAPFTEGFDRIMVLGIRLSTDPAENKLDLEQLIDNHHYSPDGMSLLPQGTPTNNTDSKGSGFSSGDTNSEKSFSIELGNPNFTSTDEELKKKDGQRLAEALGIAPESLHYLEFSGRSDISDAKIFNKALWPATWGYYLDELLGLNIDLIKKIRAFFTDNVSGRGSLPAIRIGNQPYGILVTSSFKKWQISDKVEQGDSEFLRQFTDVITTIDQAWNNLVEEVSSVDASGNAFDHLLNMLGLHASSVEHFNRKALKQIFWWNYNTFQQGSAAGGAFGNIADQQFQNFNSQTLSVLTQLGFIDPGFSPPEIFHLVFQSASSKLDYPFVDDVEKVEEEVFSETAEIKAKYQVETEENQTVLRNYIGWIVKNITSTLKSESFIDENGDEVSAPKALLYRLLRRSLLLANYEASMNYYEELGIITPETRKELDFINIKEERDVTRWEFMEADIRVLRPELDLEMAVADFLSSGPGVNLPAALTFAEVKECIAKLEIFETARLERLLAEHIDLCSYRLDAWQTALFSNRLESLAALKKGTDVENPAPNTPYLGAFGWLENLSPSNSEQAVPVEQIPESLREEGINYVEQLDNGGFIHGPSINHAVAAAIMRNAYLTHFKPEDPNHFSVNLSSKRVRIAASFLEGVRNGQKLGALLGYEFERNLADRFLVAGESLNQFILGFRTRFPLVADKITPDEDGDQIESKEARNVLDGYALIEATHIAEEKLNFPYGIDALNDVAPEIQEAVEQEVENLFGLFDAISDLCLAEGVFQVAQGNYDRAGAMLKALSEGDVMPEPEIIRTPRSGVAVNHKINLHFDTTDIQPLWDTQPTPRAAIEPGLNHWLESILGLPQHIKFALSYKSADETIEDEVILSIADLQIHAIDLVYLVGAEVGQVIKGETVNDLTELENRIDSLYRTRRRTADPDWDASGRTTIHFMRREGLGPEDKTLFEMLPLLRALQHIISSCRPVGADDYMLASESGAGDQQNANLKCWDLNELETRLKPFIDQFKSILDTLLSHIPLTPEGDLDETADMNGVDFEAIRNHLAALSNFGLPNAYPVNAVFVHLSPTANEEQQAQLLREQLTLLEQALLTYQDGIDRYEQANVLHGYTHLEPGKASELSIEQKTAIQQNAAKLIFGDAFQLIPTFEFKGITELREAFRFSNEVAPEESCLRFAQQQRAAQNQQSGISDWRPFIIEEWMQSVAAVREKTALLESVASFGEVFETVELSFKPLQLPFNENAYWMAVEYPDPNAAEVEDPFFPEGDFLSVVQQLPAGHIIEQVQAGLVIDEWNEVIPNAAETTGIAVHYNQPNTEPPQTLLLAVSPVMTGNWDWDDLVDVLEDTLERAKKRAVEPDHILNSNYAQLLPAIISVYTPIAVNTISTSLANEIKAVDSG